MSRRLVASLVILAGAVVALLLLSRSEPTGRAAAPPAERTAPAPRSAIVEPSDPPPAPKRIGISGICRRSGPVEGATVFAYPVSHERQGHFPSAPVTSVSGPDGRYAMDLPPGRYVLFAAHEELRSPRLDRRLDGVREVDFTIEPGAAELRVRLVGIATLDSFHVSVRIEPVRAADASAGVVRDLHAGDLCRVFVTPKPGYFVRPARKYLENQLGSRMHFDVWIEEGAQDLEIAVGRFAILRGKVLSPKSPYRRLRVEVRSPSAYKPRAEIKATGEARYELRVLPNEPLALFVSPLESFGLYRPIAVPPIEPDEERTLDVALARLPRRVRGVLLDPAGQPIGDAKVSAAVEVGVPGASPFVVFASTTTDAQGEFSLDGLPAGTVRVRATAGERDDIAAPPTMSLAEFDGTRVITLVAPEAAVLRGRIVSPPRTTRFVPCMRATPRLDDGTLDHARGEVRLIEDDGTFSFWIAPGVYELRLDLNGLLVGPEFEPVTLTASGAEVELRLPE